MTSIGNTDPRTKLFLVICMSFLAVFITDVGFLAVILAAVVLAMLLFGVNPLGTMKKAKLLLSMMLFIALMQSVFTPGGDPLVLIGNIHIMTSQGLKMALEFILRMLIIVASAGILATSSSREIIQGLVQWKLPYEVAFMAVMGISFIPKFAEEFKDAMTAVQLRGIDLKALSITQKIEIYASMLQPVVVGAVLKSKALSMSIEMRGFHLYPNRTSYFLLKLSRKDYLIIGFTGILTVIITVLYGLKGVIS